MKSAIGSYLSASFLVALQLAAPALSFTPPSRVLVLPSPPLSPPQALVRTCERRRSFPITPPSSRWMAEKESDDQSESDDDSAPATSEAKDESLNRFQKLRRRLFPAKEDDGLTFRQKLAKAGLSVALSYGWVSNVSYSITVSLAWYIFSKRTGLSPLAPDQWKGFLAVYAGFWVFNNVIRPVRFGLSVGVSMYFDRVVAGIQKKFNVSKGVAIGLTIFLANVVGTITLMCAGITLASMAAGVPIFPPKA